MDAAATINFKSGEAQRLFEGGYYSRVAFIMYILVNCQNSRRGQSKCMHAVDDRSDEAMASQAEESRSVGMLRGIVKNLQLKRCVKHLLLLCSSHLSHHAFTRGHAGASGHACIDS